MGHGSCSKHLSQHSFPFNQSKDDKSRVASRVMAHDGGVSGVRFRGKGIQETWLLTMLADRSDRAAATCVLCHCDDDEVMWKVRGESREMSCQRGHIQTSGATDRDPQHWGGLLAAADVTNAKCFNWFQCFRFQRISFFSTHFRCLLHIKEDSHQTWDVWVFPAYLVTRTMRSRRPRRRQRRQRPSQVSLKPSRAWRQYFENLLRPRPPLCFTMFEYPQWLTLLGGERGRGWRISDNTQCQHRGDSYLPPRKLFLSMIKSEDFIVLVGNFFTWEQNHFPLPALRPWFHIICLTGSQSHPLLLKFCQNYGGTANRVMLKSRGVTQHNEPGGGGLFCVDSEFWF